MAVVGERVFHFGREGGNERLSCLSSSTGDTLWSKEHKVDYADVFGYGDGPRATPLVDGDRVYSYGVRGTLNCYRVSNAEELWNIDTERMLGAEPGMYGFGSTPIIDGDKLLLIAGGGEGADGTGHGIVALDKYDGALCYSVTADLASYASPQVATIGSRRLCFALVRDGLICFDVDSGEREFHFPWQARVSGCVNAATPVVHENEVFITESYGRGSALLRVKAGGYDVVWRDSPRRRAKAMECHWSTPIFHDGYLYGCSGRHSSEAELRCIDWKTGRIQWSEPTWSRCSLLYADGHLIVLSEHGELSLIKATPNAYEVVASYRSQDDPPTRHIIDYPAWAAPAFCDGTLYISGNRELVCLELISRQR